MGQLSSSDYNLLQLYVGTVLKRVAAGNCDHLKAVEDLMHPLSAWSAGTETSAEFAPYMRKQLNRWTR